MTICPARPGSPPLRAPQEDQSVLVVPPLEEVDTLVRQNVRHRNEQQYDFHGRSLAALAAAARADLIREARRWTAAYTSSTRQQVGTEDGMGKTHSLARRACISCSCRSIDPLPEDATDRVFLAGHQPQLFHPGVWLKNFALGSLAEKHGAVAVNLLIDSDTAKQTALRVPGLEGGQLHVGMLPFDSPQPRLPYEQRPVVDAKRFAAFGRRVAERIRPLVAKPLIETYWPMVLKRMEILGPAAPGSLGAALAQARHQLERQWGLQTLEVPQSRVCDTPSFRWFAAHLLAQLPRLHQCYNAAVRQYRRKQGIRSHAHPVPDLASDGSWLEAPFWVWTVADPRRRPLFARQRGREILLSDRRGLEVCLPLASEGDLGAAVERLAQAAEQGVKIRCRALITTLWARLLLGDLFIHGIGGAKYDRVADSLIETFFGLRAPCFLVLSGTMHLPRPDDMACGSADSPAEELRRVRRQLRDLQYHPERWIDASPAPTSSSAAAARWVEQKRHWIRTPQTRENARTRCQAIRQANERLQPLVERHRRTLQRRLADAEQALRADAILTWREYAFCLHSEPAFRRFVERVLG